MRDYIKAHFAVRRLRGYYINVDEMILKAGDQYPPDDGSENLADGSGGTGKQKSANCGHEKREGDIAGHPVALFGPELKGSPKLAIFITTRDIIEAELKAGWLGANGIPCIVTGRATSSAVFGNMFDASKMTVLIPEDKVEEAERLIEILETGDNLSLAEEENP